MLSPATDLAMLRTLKGGVMRNLLVVCLLLMFAAPAAAKLYKCQDTEGNTVYTDEPCADGKELKLPPLHTYTPVKVPPTFPAPDDSNGSTDGNAESYTSLTILSPKNDEVIYSNSGTITVGFQLAPALQTSEGHQFSIALDGKQLKSKGVTNQIKLQNVDRGTHSVQIFVIDKSNNILLSSPSVSFHLRKESVITTPIPGSPEKAPQVQGAPAAPRASGL